MRVFATVGTGEFDGLIRESDKLNADVVCQIGRGKYTPKKKWFRYTGNMNKWQDWADVIVTHGGGGTLFEALENGKRVIGVPNPKRTDRHQEELLKELAKRKLIIYCRDARNIKHHLRSGRRLKKYSSGSSLIPKVVAKALEETA